MTEVEMELLHFLMSLHSCSLMEHVYLACKLLIPNLSYEEGLTFEQIYTAAVGHSVKPNDHKCFFEWLTAVIRNVYTFSMD